MTRPERLFGVLAGALIPAFAMACTGTIDGRSAHSPQASGPADRTPGGSPDDKPGGGGPDPGTGGSPPVGDGPKTCAQLGASPLHRLTRLEYDNTILDLVGENMNLSKDFAFDERAGDFAANYFTPISEVEFSQYATAAEAVAEKAVAKLAQVVPCDPASDAAGCSNKFIRQFGRRVFRRPLEETEVSRYQTLFDLGRTGLDFANGVRLVTQAMLQSPKFLYLVEGPGPLTQHQLAARLSYFLWNAPPDGQLATAADEGHLGTSAELQTQAKRMMADARAAAMLIDFHKQWLGLEEWEMGKDEKVYPEFSALAPFLFGETERFLGETFMSDGGKLETLMTASFSVVNGPLAKLYGVSGPTSDTEWRKVMLDPKQRAGVFTHASFLSAHGAYDASSPIRRGLAIRERFLCSPMPVPPPGADATFPKATPTQTTRQRFDKHRTDPTCATCHELMDKIGYGFETYDGIGRYRTTENGAAVDDSGELIDTDDIDGAFRGTPDLSRKLLGSKQVQKCVSDQWFRYAFGRLDTKADKCTLDSLATSFAGSGLKVSDLLMAIVQSDGFRTYTALQ